MSEINDPFTLLEDEIRIRARLEGRHRHPQGIWDKNQGLLYMLAPSEGQEPSTMMEDLNASVPVYSSTPSDQLSIVRIEHVDKVRHTLQVTTGDCALRVPESRILWVPGVPY
jgi:hypothetical protein